LKGKLEVWAYVSSLTTDSPYKIARFCVRVLHQTLGFIEDTVNRHLKLVHELIRQIKLAKEAGEKVSRQSTSNDLIAHTAQLQELLESAHANIIAAKSSR